MAENNSHGIFSEWQPKYAEHGIATFPVANKHPCVKGWQNVGLPGSAQLALKFLEAQALGFQCGSRSRITILDIDSSDKGMVGEAIRIYGDSPVIWRTGSGNHAMPFRHNGERRHIRPNRGIPIDVLGGGYAVLPPSMGSNGPYEFLQGSLADLDRLPVLSIPAKENAPWRKLREGDGRHDHLLKATLHSARQVDSFNDLLDWAETRTEEFFEPLNNDEVVGIVQWCWEQQQSGNNWTERRGMFIHHDDYERIRKQGGPDAWLLYSDLRYHHWGRDFVLANAMGNSLEWGRPRFYAARNALLRLGVIKQILPASRHRPAQYRLIQGVLASTPIRKQGFPLRG